MSTDFLHGVEVLEVQGGPRPIRTLKSSVIGLVGTALKGPVNTPTLITTRKQGVETFGLDFGTIPDALDAVYDQAGASVVVVNVFEPTVHVKEVAAAAYTLTEGAVTLPAPAHPLSAVVVKSQNGVTTYEADKHYTVDVDTGTVARKAHQDAPAADATIKIGYKHPDEADPDLVAAVRGGVDTASGAYTGVHALLAAESVCKAQPRILIAPGYTGRVTDQGAATEPLVSMYAIADRLRAVVIADGPNTTDAKAVTFRESIGHRRTYVVDPQVKVWDDEASGEAAAPASARVAGVIAKSDAERGFWWSPSNREIYGIVGTARPVDFALGDANARANHLNKNEVATIIQKNGYRLWGNRTCSADPKWAFLSVVRTADMINDSLARAHMWAVDRCITKTYIEDVTEGVNAYLRRLKAQGAILGGQCWADPELNTTDQIADGKVCFDFDFTPVYPAERVTFRSRLVNDYIEEVLA